MSNRPLSRLLLLLPLLAAGSCGADGRWSTVAGTVAIDGKPVDTGTIHFQSHADSSSSGGGLVTDGRFQVRTSDGFAPGQYSVVLQAFRRTGRTLKDPQKGRVEETASVPLRDSPQEVAVTPENAGGLALNFSSAK
ncbi:MAG: hypothetical protein DCC67_15650 [Planctomycetota bacterium]|nr:MAG: hypothetical protein DCC67_15650 [Planctomycetota bacterium]